MKRPHMEERLRRLVETDVCGADSAEKYREELKELAGTVAPSEELRRQSRYLKALSDEKRLLILRLLEVREMCVCELSIALGVSQPNLSHHMKILEGQEIVRSTKKGKWVYYSISDDRVKQVLKDLT